MRGRKEGEGGRKRGSERYDVHTDIRTSLHIPTEQSSPEAKLTVPFADWYGAHTPSCIQQTRHSRSPEHWHEGSPTMAQKCVHTTLLLRSSIHSPLHMYAYVHMTCNKQTEVSTRKPIDNNIEIHTNRQKLAHTIHRHTCIYMYM